MAKLGGVSIQATGTITSGEASTLTFATMRTYVVVTNLSAVTAYCRINSATVSATVFDFVVPAGNTEAKTFTINDMDVLTIGVFMAATSGLYASGFTGYGV